MNNDIKVILFDFGGVLAEEGFKEGLQAIATLSGLDPKSFFDKATKLIYQSGYVTGKCNEAHYWNLVRLEFDLSYTDEWMRAQIMQRFILRDWMFSLVTELRIGGYWVGILSDQTQWLDQLNDSFRFFDKFHQVFNSYHLGLGKKDHSIFPFIAKKLQVDPEKIIFIDDNPGNVARACSQGWKGILYENRGQLFADLARLGLEVPGSKI